MEDKLHLGEFEEIVLLAVLRSRDDAYGVTIKRTVEEVAGRSTSIGAIYATLDRLEEKGFVRSWRGEPRAERGGRAKRYFAVEGAGVRALAEAELMRSRLRAGLTFVPAEPEREPEINRRGTERPVQPEPDPLPRIQRRSPIELLELARQQGVRPATRFEDLLGKGTAGDDRFDVDTFSAARLEWEREETPLGTEAVKTGKLGLTEQ